jgi:hypothetical protein
MSSQPPNLYFSLDVFHPSLGPVFHSFTPCPWVPLCAAIRSRVTSRVSRLCTPLFATVLEYISIASIAARSPHPIVHHSMDRQLPRSERTLSLAAMAAYPVSTTDTAGFSPVCRVPAVLAGCIQVPSSMTLTRRPEVFDVDFVVQQLQ